jgi:formate dehydrogenase iron-sulfur subunit
VIGMDPVSNTAAKCTLCYDRLQNGMVPACAQACPTASIQFGTIADLRQRADARVNDLHGQGKTSAYIYGKEDMLGGLNSFFLLTDRPEVYGLPARPRLPSVNSVPSWLFSFGTAIVAGILGVVGFRKARMDAMKHSLGPREEP